MNSTLGAPVAGFTTEDGTAPETAPDVTIAFGDVFHATVPGSQLTRRGDSYVFSGNVDGIKQVIVDYAKERVRVTGQRVDLGDVPVGEYPLLLILTRAEDERAVLVRATRSSKFLRY